MSLIPWRNKRSDGTGRELAPLEGLRNEMDRLFESFIQDPFGAASHALASVGGWAPTIDVTENKDTVTVRAELPGVKAEDLDVSVTGDTLLLAGEKKETIEKQEKNYWHCESRFGSFRRQVRLPSEVDAEHVEAKYADGVLTVQLKKSQASQAKRIAVKSS